MTPDQIIRHADGIRAEVARQEAARAEAERVRAERHRANAIDRAQCVMLSIVAPSLGLPEHLPASYHAGDADSLCRYALGESFELVVRRHAGGGGRLIWCAVVEAGWPVAEDRHAEVGDDGGYVEGVFDVDRDATPEARFLVFADAVAEVVGMVGVEVN